MRKLEPLVHVVLLLGALLACGKKSSSSDSSAPSPGAPGPGAGNGPATAETATVVAAPILIHDYKSNEVKADTMWKGKLVQIAGAVGEVKKDFTDSIYVTLGGGGQFELETVHCMMRSDQAAAAANLVKGKAVFMKGRVKGMVMLSVLVDDCEIVPDPPTVAATAQPQPAPPAHPAPGRPRKK